MSVVDAHLRLYRMLRLHRTHGYRIEEAIRLVSVCLSLAETWTAWNRGPMHARGEQKQRSREKLTLCMRLN